MKDTIWCLHTKTSNGSDISVHFLLDDPLIVCVLCGQFPPSLTLRLLPATALHPLLTSTTK